LKTTDRVFGCLLILGGMGHTGGTLIGYKSKPELMLWSLSASLFIFLLGTLNLVRAGRHEDSALGWITLVFNVCQIVSVIAFGRLIQNMLDARVIGFTVILLVLCAMSLQTISDGSREARRASQRG
jgi:predicted MFS family arabinose efflux permease